MKQLHNSTSICNDETLIDDVYYTLSTVVLFFIGIFGFIFNLSVIVLIWKDKKVFKKVP